MRKIIWLSLIILSLSLSGCKLMGGNENSQARAEEKLLNMDGYAALVQVSHVGDDKSNTYQAKQIYDMNGNYRFEVVEPEHIAGLTTFFNGEKVIQYNPNVDEPKAVELPVNDFRNQIFLGSFIENYLQSENVSIEVQKTKESLVTVLEAIIPGGSIHMSSQKLWIDQETKEPVRMVIYNEDQAETVIVEFNEFTYNPEIKESIFTIE